MRGNREPEVPSDQHHARWRTVFPGLMLTASLCLMVAGCGARGELAFMPHGAAPGTVETVLVSTTRASAAAPALYSDARSADPQFARFDISVPPDRKPGTVTFSKRNVVNPETDFVVTSFKRLPDDRAFLSAVNTEVARRPPAARDAVLFVHGYNTNFAEGLFRQAQLQYDYGRHSVSVHFAWPSHPSTLAYIADRESALYSRDALQTTIDTLGRSNATRMDLVGHSMGAFLLMDTLRLMARTENDAFFRKVNAVILISPDIDIDVFKKEAEPVLARGVKIYVLVSSGDRALKISARLRGERSRLGSIKSADELGGIPVTVIDLSAIESSDSLGHFKSATSPDVIAFVNAVHKAGGGVFNEGRQRGLVQGSVAVLQQGTNILLSPLGSTTQ